MGYDRSTLGPAAREQYDAQIAAQNAFALRTALDPAGRPQPHPIAQTPRLAPTPQRPATSPPSSSLSLAARKAQSTGAGFQKVILASLSLMTCPVALEELPSCGAKFITKGRFIRLPIPCDLVGCVRGCGVAFHADAKSLGDSYATFPLTDRKKIEPHQILHLCRMGRAGAVAGMLVESKRVAMYLWLDWRHLEGRERIAWDDPCWVRLGNTGRLVNFAPIVEAELVRRAMRGATCRK